MSAFDDVVAYAEAERERANAAEREVWRLRFGIEALAANWAATDYRGNRPAEHTCAAALRTLLDEQ